MNALYQTINLRTILLKLLATIALIMSVVPTLTAQVDITGEIMTKDGQAVSYASVLLLQPSDSSLAQGAISSNEGKFSLSVQAGEYILNISMIGYEPHFSRMYLNDSPEAILLPTFYLSESVQQLGEV